MTAGLNRCLFIGRLGADPELRHTQAGLAMVTVNVAVDESWRDRKTGEKKSDCQWIRLVLMGSQADYCAAHSAKGSLVYAEGKLVTRKWQDRSGQDRWTTEVIVRNFQLLGSNPKLDNMPEQYRSRSQPNDVAESYASERHLERDEVPF